MHTKTITPCGSESAWTAADNYHLGSGIWDLDEPRQLGLAGRTLHEPLTIIICLWLGLFAPLRFLERDLQKLMIIRKIELRQFLDIEYDVLKKQRKVRDRLTRLCQPLCSLSIYLGVNLLQGWGAQPIKSTKVHWCRPSGCIQMCTRQGNCSAPVHTNPNVHMWTHTTHIHTPKQAHALHTRIIYHIMIKITGSICMAWINHGNW